MYNNVINKLEQKLMTFYILFYYDYFSYLYSCQINYVVNCNYLLLYIDKLKLSNCNKNM